MRVVIDAGWEANVAGATDALFEGTLGPEIRDDAKRYCPVDTGHLRESIEDHLEGNTLVVSAAGGAGAPPREYAVYVEMGHRVFHPSTGVTGPEVVPAEPYLRPALYTER